MSKRARDLIEEFQPYNNASGSYREHPLWILGSLNNIDKHREFNIAILNVSDVVQFDLMTDDASAIIMTLQLPGNMEKERPITDGAVIGEPPFPAGTGQMWRIGVQSRLGLQETKEVGLGGSLTLSAVIRQLLDYVRDVVVPKFKPLL